MKQKSRIASKLFAVLVVLTLISCCFLGTTFARYTSRQSGDASVGVAKWDIAFTDDEGSTLTDEATIDFGKLSPSQNGYTVGTIEKNSTAAILVAAIENKSTDVDAMLTINYDATPTYSSEDSEKFDGTGYGWNGMENKITGNGASKGQVDALFTIDVWYTKTSTFENQIKISSGAGINLVARDAATSDETNIIYVWAQVTWNTNYGGENAADSAGLFQDTIDTWVGENISAVQWGFDFTAVQASEQPTT